MSNSIRTTYPIWHQPWACFACEKYGEVGVQVKDPASGTVLKKLVAAIDQDHRTLSPLCPQDVSTKYQGRMALVLKRPFRVGNTTGKIIFAPLPSEEEATAHLPEKERQQAQTVLALRTPHAPWRAWPPWLEGSA